MSPLLPPVVALLDAEALDDGEQRQLEEVEAFLAERGLEVDVEGNAQTTLSVWKAGNQAGNWREFEGVRPLDSKPVYQALTRLRARLDEPD